MQKDREMKELAPMTDIFRLTADNAHFERKNALLTLSVQQSDGEPAYYDRVILKRAFPFDMPWAHIAVMDGNEREIGMIAVLDDFEGETAELLRVELERIYYTPMIKRILSLKERYGFSYWQVETEDGDVSFTVQDTFRNLLRIGEDRVAIFDVDGNRFEIASLETLDRKSYKKIELYL